MADRPPTQKRVPKLAYRNPLTADQTSITSHNSSTSAATIKDVVPVERQLTASSVSTSSPVRPSADSQKSPPSTSFSNNERKSSVASLPTKKKKQNAIVGFFTLREPSQSAFEQYAQEQRKQAAERGGISANSIANVSLQKLPPNVPKVNSKWDGIPQGMKQDARSKKDKKNTLSRKGSKFPGAPSSSLFSSSSEVDRKTHSPLVSNRRPQLTITSSKGGWTESEVSLPEMTYFFPDDPGPSSRVPGPPSVSYHKTSTNGHQRKATVSPHFRPKLETIEEPTVVSNAAPTVASSESVEDVGETEQEVSLEDCREFSPEATSTVADFTPLSTSTASRAVRPTTPNFSRPLSSQSSQSPEPPRSSTSTISNRPHSSAISIDADAPVGSEVAGERILSSSASIAPSFAPSYVPSELSDSWYKTSRERLGLGGRIRKDDVLPWESNGGLTPGMARNHSHPMRSIAEESQQELNRV